MHWAPHHYLTYLVSAMKEIQSGLDIISNILGWISVKFFYMWWDQPSSLFLGVPCLQRGDVHEGFDDVIIKGFSGKLVLRT